MWIVKQYHRPRPGGGLPTVERLEDRRLLSGLAVLSELQPLRVAGALTPVLSRVVALTQTITSPLLANPVHAVAPSVDRATASLSEVTPPQTGSLTPPAISLAPAVAGPVATMVPLPSGVTVTPASPSVSEAVPAQETQAPPTAPVNQAVTTTAGVPAEAAAAPLPLPAGPLAPRLIAGADGALSPESGTITVGALLADVPEIAPGGNAGVEQPATAADAPRLVPQTSGLLTRFLPLDPVALEQIGATESGAPPEVLSLYPWLTAAAVAAAAYEVARRQMQWTAPGSLLGGPV